MMTRRWALVAMLAAAAWTAPVRAWSEDGQEKAAAEVGTGTAVAASVDAGSQPLFAPPGSSSDWFFGGGVGFGFGDVDYLELSPMAGVWLSPNVSVGATLIYRYRRDSRWSEDISTSDWGGSVFGRYIVWDPLFLHAEVEYLDYEYVQFDLSTERDGYTSVLLGGGAAMPIGRSTSFYAVALYNVAYDSGERSPYGSPWIFRFGVGVGL